MLRSGQHKSTNPMVWEGKMDEVSFTVPLFFRPKFIYRKGAKQVRSFFYQHDRASAIIHYSEEEPHQLISLSKSPFGSIYGSEEISVSALEEFIVFMKKQLQTEGINRIIIKHYPACYGCSMHDKVMLALTRQGFKITGTEQNQYLLLQNIAQEKLFDHAKLHLVKKCKEAGFQQYISSGFDCDEWYDLISQSRINRGHPLTLTKEELKEIHSSYPESYYFFEIRDKQRLIACAIGVKVLDDVLYYYMAASDPEYQAYSPMSMLLYYMYGFALEQNFKVFDMGISSVNGILNEGLHWFKKSFGAQDEPKYILQWDALEKGETDAR